MKQKIVIRVCYCCDGCRSKAMAVAAAMCGVDSVAINGKYREELVVVGECVDSIKLTAALRKKVCRADLLEVTEVKKDDKKPPPPVTEVKKDDKKPAPPPPPPVTFVCHLCCHPVGYRSYSCYCHCHYHYH